ncbi:extracellular solute-binding protein [Acidomonas methanolica]|uniref:extracellular solute-binding protein n=1 Tax=Acidomonas methanolica TaxID=437 RepID=UPI00211A27A7
MSHFSFRVALLRPARSASRTGTPLHPPCALPVRLALLRRVRQGGLVLAALATGLTLPPDQSQARPRQSHHAGRPARSSQPVFAVPSGISASDTLVMPDQPFALQSWDGLLETLRQHATAPTMTWSAVMLDDMLLALACRDGLVQHLAPAAPASGAQAGESPCGIPAGTSRIVLAWDQSRIGNGATDWSALWDVAQHPGKRGLRLDPRSTLEIALLADGVAPNDIYTTLATTSGVDRAFRKLDQLRPYIVWWRTPEDAARIMSSGSALMTSTPADELTAIGSKSGFVALWTQSLLQNLSWAVPRNLPNADVAHIVTMLRDQPRHHNDPPDKAAGKTQSLTIDDKFWADHWEELQQRMESWLKQSP